MKRKRFQLPFGNDKIIITRYCIKIKRNTKEIKKKKRGKEARKGL